MSTGKCPECPYRWRLRRDGTIGRHRLYTGDGKRIMCIGSGLHPVDETHALCKDEHHRCADGGGPGEYARYIDGKCGLEAGDHRPAL